MKRDEDKGRVSEFENSAVHIKDLVPLMGGCCCITSAFTVYPDIIGCYGQNSCLCIDVEYKFCKISKEEKFFCTFQETSCKGIIPTTCLQADLQIFCIDFRCALPWDDDVPCMINCCGVTLFHNVSRIFKYIHVNIFNLYFILISFNLNLV
jgi:hypothetical protein